MVVKRITDKYGLYKGIRNGCFIMSRRNKKYLARDSGCLTKARVDELNLLKCSDEDFNRIGQEICIVPM